jgi:hypothetical protein
MTQPAWPPYPPPLLPHGLETEHRLTILEVDRDRHRERLDLIEGHHHSLKDQLSDTAITTPVGKLPLPIAIALFLWLAAKYPEAALKFIGL